MFQLDTERCGRSETVFLGSQITLDANGNVLQISEICIDRLSRMMMFGQIVFQSVDAFQQRLHLLSEFCQFGDVQRQASCVHFFLEQIVGTVLDVFQLELFLFDVTTDVLRK